MRNHFEQREKFPCDICHFECATKDNLKKHRKTHAEQEKFPCDICTDQFTFKPNLIRHKLAKHPEDQCR